MKKLTILRAFFVAAMMLTGSAHAFAAHYDSIAVDDDTGTSGGQAGYGVGEGDSAEEAKHEAMKQCRSSGNHSCEVAVTYQRCGAYASSKKNSGTGTGSSEAAARSEALHECGVSACRVVVSDCVGKE